MDVAAQAAARAELAADLDTLKARGVKSFEQLPGGFFKVEFFTPAPAAMPEADKTQADPDVCKCGHPQHAHMNGYCVEGCDAKVCEPEKKP